MNLVLSLECGHTVSNGLYQIHEVFENMVRTFQLDIGVLRNVEVKQECLIAITTHYSMFIDRIPSILQTMPHVRTA